MNFFSSSSSPHFALSTCCPELSVVAMMSTGSLAFTVRSFFPSMVNVTSPSISCPAALRRAKVMVFSFDFSSLSGMLQKNAVGFEPSGRLVVPSWLSPLMSVTSASAIIK